jgi:hypothetical protein
MIPINDAGRRDRIAFIDRMIQQYRHAQKRRLVRQAISLWRKIEAHQRFLDCEKPLDRVH